MFVGTLRPFQEEARERMVEEQRLLLAAIMGAGKTPISIATIEHLIEDEYVEKGLLIVPASLRRQWLREVDKFTDVAVPILVEGPRHLRERAYEKFDRNGEYLVMSYNTAVSDWDVIHQLDFQFVLADEVQAIKDPTSQRSQVVKDVMGTVDYRYGLTGTPVENKAEEVFSIMEGLDPDLFGPARAFDRTFIVRDNWGKPVKYVNPGLFHSTLSKRMFRVSAKDIEDQLPGMQELEEDVSFDAKSLRLWRHIATELLHDLQQAAELGSSRFDIDTHYSSARDSQENLALRGQIMSKVTCLRMLGDHPQLLVRSAESYKDTTTKLGSQYAAALKGKGLLDGLPKTSEKYRRSIELIEELTESGEKVVLFSFFKPTLSWLQHDLKKKGIEAVLFTGDMDGKAKDESQQRFLHDEQVKVFLASDAGGQGVDLPIAKYLINFNLPWSGGQYAQRNARIRRISSENERIVIINMLVDKSIDVRQYGMLRLKQAAADAIVDGIFEEDQSLDINNETLREFLEQTLE